MIDVEALTRRYGHTAAPDGLTFTVPAGRVCGSLGPERRREDDDAAHILLGLTRAGRATVGGTVNGVLDRDGFHPARSALGELALAAARAGARPERAAAVARGGRPGSGGRPADRRVLARRPSPARAGRGAPHPAGRTAAGRARHGPGSPRAPCTAGPVRAHAAEGGTVLLSSHVLEEVASTCDRVAVVDRGRCVRAGRWSSCSPGASACVPPIPLSYWRSCEVEG
jgi:ABC-2 type transport system ATP-binding protein